jgi:hypothetical protein
MKPFRRQPGPLTLLYPQWMPGNHSPTGPIDKIAGLVVKANGKTLQWTRDQYNVYAFHIDVPQGTSAVDVSFEYLTPQSNREGRVVMTPEMLEPAVERQYAVSGRLLRKADHGRSQPEAADRLAVRHCAGSGLQRWRYGEFQADQLRRSGRFAGLCRQVFQARRPRSGCERRCMDIVADEAKYLEIKPEQLKVHLNLVQQMYKLYGAHHYDHYDFPVSLSDKMSGEGLEHHRSSEDGVGTGYFTEWDKNLRLSAICSRTSSTTRGMASTVGAPIWLRRISMCRWGQPAVGL